MEHPAHKNWDTFCLQNSHVFTGAGFEAAVLLAGPITNFLCGKTAFVDVVETVFVETVFVETGVGDGVGVLFNDEVDTPGQIPKKMVKIVNTVGIRILDA